MGSYNFKADLLWCCGAQWAISTDVTTQRTPFSSISSNWKPGSANPGGWKAVIQQRDIKGFASNIWYTEWLSPQEQRSDHHFLMRMILLSLSLCATLDLYLGVMASQEPSLPILKYCAACTWSDYTAAEATFVITGQYRCSPYETCPPFLCKERSRQRCCRSETARFYLCNVSLLTRYSKTLMGMCIDQ